MSRPPTPVSVHTGKGGRSRRAIGQRLTRKNQPNFPEPSSSWASGCSRCHRNTYTFETQKAACKTTIKEI